MPFLSRGVCYSSLQDAANALCSFMTESKGPDTISWCISAVPKSSYSVTLTMMHMPSSTSFTQKTYPIPFQTCDASLIAQPFDYVYASAIWSMAFCFVLGLYFVSKKAGLILGFIRGH